MLLQIPFASPVGYAQNAWFLSPVSGVRLFLFENRNCAISQMAASSCEIGILRITLQPSRLFSLAYAYDRRMLPRNAGQRRKVPVRDAERRGTGSKARLQTILRYYRVYLYEEGFG